MTTDERYPRVQFRAGDLLPALTDRAGPADVIHQVARRDLERYYYALREELANVDLDAGEAALICDVCNGTLWEPHTIGFLRGQIVEAIENGPYAEKWDVDGYALVAKLRTYPYARLLAIVDAAERFWQRVGRGENGETADDLRAVGLLR